jgi:RimJ/RimL family protein N-acetyltransferase
MHPQQETYHVVVEGHLGDHWSDWLGVGRLANNGDGTSTLSLAAADQAQLYGLLDGLRDIGATLVSLHAKEAERMEESGNEPETPRSPISSPLRTERLTLRAAIAQDATSTFEYRRLEQVSRWLTDLPTDFEKYRAKFVEPARLAAAVVVELAGDTIGDFMLRIEDAWSQTEVADAARKRSAELGWVLNPAYTGHGYATEAVRELLRFCFEEIGIHRVTAICFSDNTESWRLMERVGMRRESHTVRDSLHRSGKWLDGYTYALLADEWFSGVGAAHHGQRDAGDEGRVV